MALNSNQITMVILGGIFLGVWAYLGLFVMANDPVAWAGWGFLGLLMAAGAFAAMVAGNDLVRLVVWAALGIAVGILITASLTNQNPAMMATFLTFAGGGLITSAIPYKRPEQQTWIVSDERPE